TRADDVRLSVGILAPGADRRFTAQKDDIPAAGIQEQELPQDLLAIASQTIRLIHRARHDPNGPVSAQAADSPRRWRACERQSTGSSPVLVPVAAVTNPSAGGRRPATATARHGHGGSPGQRRRQYGNRGVWRAPRSAATRSSTGTQWTWVHT